MTNIFKNSWVSAIGVGLAGALGVTLYNEVARKVFPRAPRLDILGERTIKKGLKSIGVSPPRGDNLYWWALAGDLLTNTVFYSFVRRARSPLSRGVSLGTFAGLCALVVPEMIGLGRRHRGFTNQTKAMTVGHYVFGGLASAAATHLFAPPVIARA